MNNKTKITWEKRIKLTDTIIKEFPILTLVIGINDYRHHNKCEH